MTEDIKLIVVDEFHSPPLYYTFFSAIRKHKQTNKFSRWKCDSEKRAVEIIKIDKNKNNDVPVGQTVSKQLSNKVSSAKVPIV
ncbi:hypothetical protein DICVIV_04371 [Dictyocaulus viviparus]|uniref:Uncharacterized protein n=1 Tax=Dictyocaulus viviparus TaxID=29172 RepID=A0A0D8Y030_DICVI|nr:hypothetical protein DICVIV_04371 [Dictyocaulus viviparus]